MGTIDHSPESIDDGSFSLRDSRVAAISVQSHNLLTSYVKPCAQFCFTVWVLVTTPSFPKTGGQNLKPVLQKVHPKRPNPSTQRPKRCSQQYHRLLPPPHVRAGCAPPTTGLPQWGDRPLRRHLPHAPHSPLLSCLPRTWAHSGGQAQSHPKLDTDCISSETAWVVRLTPRNKEEHRLTMTCHLS